MNNKASWKFSSASHGEIVGLNDAGITMFSIDIFNSLAREIIQNSIDARTTDNKPVKVEFNSFSIPVNEFPGKKRFESILGYCNDMTKDNDALEFIKKAKDIFNKSEIKVLRISDYNTTGLIGAKDGKIGEPWSRLVKEKGTSQKNDDAGGSFGIGKSSPFSASNLRTVFYSTLDKYGYSSCIGVASLISFIDKQSVESDDYTTGKGFFTDSKKLLAMEGLADFEEGYIRTEPGTDIYIMGFEDIDEWESKIIESVLLNYLVSIHRGELEIVVQNKTLNSKNLGNVIQDLKLNNDKDYNNSILALKNYYKVLSNKDKNVYSITLDNNDYGKEFGFKSGECELLLMEEKNSNRRIMMTRKNGMKIFELDRLPSGLNVTGILLMTGKNMNRIFRSMEPPAHDKWDPGTDKEKKKIYNGLKRYIRDEIRNIFSQNDVEAVDVFGINDFLPDNLLGDKEKEDKKGLELIPVVGEIKPVNMVNNKKNKEIKSKSGKPGKPGKPAKPSKPGKSEKPGKPRKPSETGKGKVARIVDVTSRIMCVDKSNGEYTMFINIPNTSNKAEISLELVGEHGSNKVEIRDAKINSGNAKIDAIKEECIVLNNLKYSERIKIDFRIDFNYYGAFSLEYKEIL